MEYKYADRSDNDRALMSYLSEPGHDWSNCGIIVFNRRTLGCVFHGVNILGEAVSDMPCEPVLVMLRKLYDDDEMFIKAVGKFISWLTTKFGGVRFFNTNNITYTWLNIHALYIGDDIRYYATLFQFQLEEAILVKSMKDQKDIITSIRCKSITENKDGVGYVSITYRISDNESENHNILEIRRDGVIFRNLVTSNIIYYLQSDKFTVRMQ